MRQTLELQQRLQTTLTPELRQVIHMMQLSTQEVEQELKSECEVNPFLELGSTREESSFDELESPKLKDELEDADSLQLDQYADVQPQSTSAELEDMTTALSNDSAVESTSLDRVEEANWEDLYTANSDLDSIDSYYIEPTSLTEHLRSQLREISMTDQEEALCEYLIDALNEDGYLLNWDSIVTELTRTFKISLRKIKVALSTVQSLAPDGVGARTVQECLQLQLRAHSENSIQRIAQRIVSKCFEELAAGSHVEIQHSLKLENQELTNAIELIQSLHPRPGADYADTTDAYITPDVLVAKKDHEWRVTLNQSSLPEVSINKEYVKLVGDSSNTRDKEYLREYLQRAQVMIYGLRVRNRTLLKAAVAIVAEQHDFFANGEHFMRPLVQADIALAIGTHPSTISRITTNKYLGCERGTYELKFFFSSHVRSKTGGDVSSTAVRAWISQWINEENPVRPLTDTVIMERLKGEGIAIARRTVSKYRESMGIPSAKIRNQATTVQGL